LNVSIIIPTILGELRLLDDLLATLCPQLAECDSEVMIVCSGVSPTPSVKILVDRWVGYFPIRVIHCPLNGLHHARHFGARNAKNPWLIYIDDDVRLSSGWLAAYQRFFESGAGVCAGGKVIPEWSGEPLEWVVDISPDIFSILDYGDRIRELASREGINGCNFAISKEALFKYKGFHPDGFNGEEKLWLRGDGEFGLIQKIKAGGEKVYYLPEAVLHHHIPKNRTRLEVVKRVCQYRAISSAYHYFRLSSNMLPAAFLLISYGAFVASLKVLLKTISADDTIKLKHELSFIRHTTFARYGLRVIVEPEFRIYIKKADYLSE
jgi:glucosyl-dolichyl phosphate glucuronosyltransferase